MEITRKQILSALRYEPLIQGYFIDPYHTEDPACKVCAVGGTLRRAGMDNRTIWSTGKILMENAEVEGLYSFSVNTETMVAGLLTKKLYLQALSCYYELTAKKFGVGIKTRRKVAEWVKKFLPVTFYGNDI